MSEQMNAAFKAWLERPCKTGKTLPELLAPAYLKIAAKGWLDGWADALATQPQAPQGGVTDAERYKKLRRWMSSNVKEGWTEVENLGAIAAYMGWDAMDEALDGLPMCTVGLCSLPAPTKTPEAGK